MASTGEKHPQAREALGIAKVNICVRNQSHKPRRQRGYNRFQIHDLCSFPYVPTDVPEKGVSAEIALSRLRAVAQGFTSTPFSTTSKCRWGPVEWPVEPVMPMVCPCWT